MRTIKEALEDGSISLEDEIDYPDMTEEEYKEEIERLNKELQDTKEHLGEYLHEQEEENKRLNNIINELKKQSNGVWVNNLLNFMEKNNIEFGSDKDATK